MSDLKLKSSGVTYSGFESAHIRVSMLELCPTFALSIDNFSDELIKAKFDIWGEVVLELGGHRVLTGWIDDLDISKGSNFDRVTIFGRGKTSDLIDCEFDSTPNEWKNQSVSTVITNLCKPYGVGVRVDPSATSETSKSIESYKVREGCSVGDMIIELCRDYGVIATTSEDGFLKITKASNLSSKDSLIVGGNVRVVEVRYANSRRYSRHVIKGQGFGRDNKGLEDYVSCEGSTTDSKVSRERPRVMFSEGPTDSLQCRKKAVQEARLSAGLSRPHVFKATSWFQSDGRPWEVNRSVKTTDIETGGNSTKIIASIDFIYDEEDGGDFSDILVVDKDTFSTSEAPIRIKGKLDP